MSFITRFLTSRWGPIVTGIFAGVLAPVLVKLGNPGNMGICVVCFSRDIAGALGLHRASIFLVSLRSLWLWSLSTRSLS